MLRPILFIAPITPGLLASPALAHPGHLGALAGHDHWVAGTAIGLAIALGLWGALKGKKTTTDQAEDEGAADSPEEASA